MRKKRKVNENTKLLIFLLNCKKHIKYKVLHIQYYVFICLRVCSCAFPVLPFYHVSGVPHTWKGIPEQCLVISVEVPACQRAAVIAHYHTIWIQHWHHLQQNKSE